MNPSATTVTFSISDLAREFGITPRTLRYWEDQGLLAPERQGQQRANGEDGRRQSAQQAGAAARPRRALIVPVV